MAKTLHLIGNAHIDPVWLWQWQEGFQEIKATFRSALDRLSESDDFLFVSSSAAFYEWVEQNDPGMFDEIRARVAEGRWELAGGWWVEPDCNLPGAESFARQGLYGQRYFASRFGRTARVGFNPDSFGHHAMLPQILRKSGLDCYVFMRPGSHEKGLPSRLFWWESDDGSRVLAFRIPFEYCTGPDELEPHVRRCAAELKEPIDALMCFYGVGNHGGGPTRRNLESLRRLGADPSLPALVFATPERYFRAVRERAAALPVVHDELQMHAVGCYAAHSAVKRDNRRAEHALLAAEKLCAIAQRVAGAPYPAAELARAWKNVLFNQFHDILAGTSLEAAYDDARDTHGEALAIAARGLNQAAQSLAWRVDIPHEEGARPVVVFNPHAWPARLPVEIECGKVLDTDVLRDESGALVPVQRVRSQASVAGWRRRLAFVADLPPLGYRLYRVTPGTAEEAAATAPVDATDTVLENARLRLEIDPATGAIAALVDKTRNVSVFRAPAARAVVLDDPSDTWSHGVVQYDREVGALRAVSCRLLERGPVRSVLRVESAYGASRLVQDFLLCRDADLVVVRVAVDWHEQFKVLKLRFPTSLHFPKATYEVPYGHLERATDGQERPGQTWLDLTGVVRATGEVYGLSLLNDGKSSFDVRAGDVGLTVLRSPIFAHHDPYVPEPGVDHAFIDQGLQRFTYALLPHAGGWEAAGTVRRAAELNQKAFALPETFHPGPLPPRDSYLEAEPENIVVTAVKLAEDGDDLIVRAFEAHRVATRATLRLPRFGRTIEADFGPCEIKTFRVPADPARPVTETDLVERPA